MNPKKVSKSGVNYDLTSSGIIEDKRFQRERALPPSVGSSVQKSSTFDALTRMAAGLESRTLRDNINDPNRPTWEQYKKDNEDKLNMTDSQASQMAAYRKQLDEEREAKLKSKMAGARSKGIYSDDESSRTSGSGSGSGSDFDDREEDDDSHRRSKKHKKEKREKKKRHKKDRKAKKEKKEKKEKKKRYNSDDESFDNLSGSISKKKVKT